MSETERVKQRRKKPTVQELLKSKRRDQRKKGRRMQRQALKDRAGDRIAHLRTYSNVMAIRRPGEEIIFGIRTGLFGHPTTTVLKVEDEKIVGATEDVKELGEIVTQLGMLTLASLVNYNLAWGPEGLAKALARWANIDLEALKKAAEEEAAADAATPSEETLQPFRDALATDEQPEAPATLEPGAGVD